MSYKNPTMPNFAFFGTPDLAVTVLEELKAKNLLPALIITSPDAPQGRGLTLTPPPVKVWAEAHGISVIQPTSFKEAIPKEITDTPWDVFVVAAYGKLLPQTLLDIPTHGTLNVHPSLLPRFRGASPIESQILADEETVGVTIMEMDAQMDHGPIVAQEVVSLPSWPIRKDELSRILAHAGGELLAHTLPEWTTQNTQSSEQDHEAATFTQKITKQQGHITFTTDPCQNYLTFCALHPNPGTYFFATKDNTEVRIKIADATYSGKTFIPTRVIPAGKKEVPYTALREQGYVLPAEAP